MKKSRSSNPRKIATYQGRRLAQGGLGPVTCHGCWKTMTPAERAELRIRCAHCNGETR